MISTIYLNYEYFQEIDIIIESDNILPVATLGLTNFFKNFKYGKVRMFIYTIIAYAYVISRDVFATF